MKNNALALLAVILSTPVFAATPELTRGTRSIDIEANFDPEQNGETTYYGTLALGYFVADHAEVRGYVGHERDAGRNLHYSLGVGGYYYFTFDSPVVPYIGVRGGWFYSDFEIPEAEDGDSWVVSPRAGLKYFLASNVAVYAHYYFLWNSEPVYNNDGDTLEDTDMGVHVGLSCYF